MIDTITTSPLKDHVMRFDGPFLRSAKTVCVSAVLDYLGIRPHQYHSTYTHKSGNRWDQILRRFGYAVRSRRSRLPKRMDKLKPALRRLNDPHGTVYAVTVWVDDDWSHLVLLNKYGQVLVDTNPRLVDCRKVVTVRAIFKQGKL